MTTYHDRREAIDAASAALAFRIETLARTATTPEATKTLAEAFSLITHGPQGGKYESGTQYAYTASTVSRQATDYHYTTHDGERKPLAGFHVREDQP